jgi:mono/diheme cytochrome c family protein
MRYSMAVSSARRVAMAAIIVAAVCAMTGADPAHAQMNTADATRGRELADRLCTGCHITSTASGATIANPDVPSFAAIAKRPDTSAERLAGRIIVPHPAMPTTQLTVGEIRDLIAYILTMKPAR